MDLEVVGTLVFFVTKRNCFGKSNNFSDVNIYDFFFNQILKLIFSANYMKNQAL